MCCFHDVKPSNNLEKLEMYKNITACGFILTASMVAGASYAAYVSKNQSAKEQAPVELQGGQFQLLDFLM
jgi:hypothetical protein